MRADARLDEEDEEQQERSGDESEEDAALADVERGNRSPATPSAKAQGKRRAGAVSGSLWKGDSSEMSVLRPNIHREDRKHAESSDDDEVPQDFMIEAKRPAAASRSPKLAMGKTKPRASTSPTVNKTPTGLPPTRSTSGGRGQPLYSVAGKAAPPLLPTHMSQPPKPSEVDYDDRSSTPRSHPRAPSSLGGALSDQGTRQQKTMRGLDEYEKALWNWVNVYNLDAFLQEVYAYYEGNGLYSIALSRGLNLL